MEHFLIHHLNQLFLSLSSLQMFIFWVTDNFLMRHTRKKRLQMTRSTSLRQSSSNGGNGSSGGGGGVSLGGSTSGSSGLSDHHHLHLPSGPMSDPSLLQRLRVKYRTLRLKESAEKQNESESEALISGDDDDNLIIGSKGGGAALTGGASSLGAGNVQQRTTNQAIQLA